jgi:hypothetical protein
MVTSTVTTAGPRAPFEPDDHPRHPAFCTYTDLPRPIPTGNHLWKVIPKPCVGGSSPLGGTPTSTWPAVMQDRTTMRRSIDAPCRNRMSKVRVRLAQPRVIRPNCHDLHRSTTRVIMKGSARQMLADPHRSTPALAPRIRPEQTLWVAIDRVPPLQRSWGSSAPRDAVPCAALGHAQVHQVVRTRSAAVTGDAEIRSHRCAAPPRMIGGADVGPGDRPGSSGLVGLG